MTNWWWWCMCVWEVPCRHCLSGTFKTYLSLHAFSCSCVYVSVSYYITFIHRLAKDRVHARIYVLAHIQNTTYRENQAHGITIQYICISICLFVLFFVCAQNALWIHLHTLITTLCANVTLSLFWESHHITKKKKKKKKTSFLTWFFA
jgi:uncharacterized membrane protein YecN with MAPEG domain